MGVSIGFHGLMLLLFFLIMAWREPDPPVPEYGIELNFGLDNIGSGEIQPEEPAAAPPLIQEQAREEETTPETIVDQPVQETEIPETQDLVEEEIIEDSEMEESPDLTQPEATPPQPQVEAEVKEEVEEQQAVQPEVEEEVAEEPVLTRSENVEEAINESEGAMGEVIGETENASQGDAADVTGDAGDPQGTLDARALYGTYGGGGGPKLELAGWIWNSEPKPKDPSNENGKIVFEIKIDDRGEIISVRTLETTVTPVVERIYKTEVESLTFSPLSNNTTPAAVSTGKITFIIRSK